ncbi:MAG: hypothetical protein QW231_01570 [Candidatus Bathyarchaeia archaeon]
MPLGTKGVVDVPPEGFADGGVLERRVLNFKDGDSLFLLKVVDGEGEMLFDGAFQSREEWNRVFREYYGRFEKEKG